MSRICSSLTCSQCLAHSSPPICDTFGIVLVHSVGGARQHRRAAAAAALHAGRSWRLAAVRVLHRPACCQKKKHCAATAALAHLPHLGLCCEKRDIPSAKANPAQPCLVLLMHYSNSLQTWNFRRAIIKVIPMKQKPGCHIEVALPTPWQRRSRGSRASSKREAMTGVNMTQ